MNTIDLAQVASVVNPNKKCVPYKANAHRFTKIAFDVFQLNDTPTESYWTLETLDDGQEYLVARYEDDTDEDTIEVKSTHKRRIDKVVI